MPRIDEQDDTGSSNNWVGVPVIDIPVYWKISAVDHIS